MNSVNASNAPSGADTTGGFHEEGGQWGTTTSGAPSVAPAIPGPANMAVVGGAHIDPTNAVDQSVKSSWQSIGGDYHVHPSGSITDANGLTHVFNQPPSGKDISVAGDGGIHIVVGAGDKRVYYYNGSGVIGQPMKLKDFMR